MNALIHCREAAKIDLPDILRLHAQPDMDNGDVLSLAEAKQVFDRMARIPTTGFMWRFATAGSWAPSPC